MLNLKKWEPVTYEKVDGHPVPMQIRRLPFLEAKEFQVHYNRIKRDKISALLAVAQTEAVEETRKRIERMNGLLERAGKPTIPEGESLDATLKEVQAACNEAGVIFTSVELAEMMTVNEDQIEARRAAMQEYLESLDAEWVRKVFTTCVQKVENLTLDGEAVTTGEGLLEIADAPMTMFVIETVHGFTTLSGAAKKASSSPPISEAVAGTDAGDSPATSAEPADGMALATAPESPIIPSSSE